VQPASARTLRVVVLDDLGYVQQTPEEGEGLFTFVHHAVVLEFVDVPTFRGPRSDSYTEHADARS